MKQLSAVLAAASLLGLAACGSTASTSATGDGSCQDAPRWSQAHCDSPTPTRATPSKQQHKTFFPDPKGKYGGTCDYLLGESLSDYEVVGEIHVKNTGNIGIAVKTKIKWPQLGHRPIVMKKRAKVAFGKKKSVRFHEHASSEQIDLLQSWQEGHGYRDGCKYKVAIVDTFGAVH
ncbi:MAG: hypothetical protein ACRDMV_19210 [Streptosporangiales bacterium]